MNNVIWLFMLISFWSCSITKTKSYNSISGIYPHLAYYNNEGECGTGAVVPWAERLWVTTYGPHEPYGSSDKLYEITTDLKKITRPESIGGTPANRMIHKESDQLFIGPYVINPNRKVRTLSYKVAPGRYTGSARHLYDPENRIYTATMEEGFYDINVHNLETETLFTDGNLLQKEGQMVQASPLLPGVHGKGLYSGQGVLVYSNNGEDSKEALEKFDIQSGSLCEWNGKTWKLIRRNQFVEVTGPGGIHGNANPDTDPIWTTGWDHKSVLLGVRDAKKGWQFFRLPKASHSYDGAHGWNTEWPRIRDVGTKNNPDFLMTMHGMFWKFPETFTQQNTAGIRPRSAYLKVIGDFARWNNRLVFGCDDAAKREFLNTRRAKGNIPGPGQSNSNLWFTGINMPDLLGPATATGSVWENEDVTANKPSDAFLFSGWNDRSCWIKNNNAESVVFSFEKDITGNNSWQSFKTVTVAGKKEVFLPFNASEKGEWIRVTASRNTNATITFTYTASDKRRIEPDDIFQGLSPVKSKNITGGLLYALGDDRRALGVLANKTINGISKEAGYYEMDENLQLVYKEDPQTASFIREKFVIPTGIMDIEESSVLIVDDKGRRWRLPLGAAAYKSKTDKGLLRICREVATERDLFQSMGTFYELPAENADGFAKIRPVATHNYHINDYASYRGMLVLTGIELSNQVNNPHIVISKDKKAAVWLGVIDDLWKLGKPTGEGGPWRNTQVKTGVPSDPYLIGFYDKRTLVLSHNSTKEINIKIEADPAGSGEWMEFATYIVKPGEEFIKTFPDSFQARWIRFTANTDTKVTAWLKYE